jgi:acyl carrier protein
MGLDSVELVIAFEEEFGLTIPDEIAEKMITVGDVYTYLKDRLRTAPEGYCITQRVFYKVRKALINNYRIQRKAILLDTKLGDLVPPEELRESWDYFGMMVGLKLPPFDRIESIWFSKRLVSADTFTVQDLVAEFVRENANELAKEKDSDENIWQRLVDVIVRQLNVSREEIAPGVSFTRDLGVD